MRRVTTLAALLLLQACQHAFNYTDVTGPRHAGNEGTTNVTRPEQLRVVTFNIRYGQNPALAIEELREAGWTDADVVLLQEVDAPCTREVADALSMQWVYYPASIHHERDFGNAILSRWPIRSDHKLVLPHRAPFDGRARIAVSARIDGPFGPFFAVSVHNETMLAGPDAQREQALAVIEDVGVRYSGLPGIVGGDFNIVSGALLYEVIDQFEQQGLNHIAPPSGVDTARSAFGSFSLDHIFARGLEASAAMVAPSRGASDHHAVSVFIGERSPR